MAIRLRAVLALVLVAVFYAMALAAAAGLLVGGWALGSGALHARGRAVVYGLLFSAAAIGVGLVVLWSILPRWDRFVPPGPQLDPQVHPPSSRRSPASPRAPASRHRSTCTWWPT
jgi:heat shock protein HtpX